MPKVSKLKRRKHRSLRTTSKKISHPTLNRRLSANVENMHHYAQLKSKTFNDRIDRVVFEKKKPYRQRRICGCPWYCLYLCILACLLTAIALSAMILKLVQNQTTTTTTVTTTTTTSMACVASCVNGVTSTDARIAFYTFDSVITDTMGVYHLNGSSTPIYAPGWINSAISFNASNQQWLTTFNMPISTRTFTIDFWFYAFVVTASWDIPFAGQCYSGAAGTCFFLSIYYEQAYMGFTNSDVSSSTKIQANIWYHIAFAFDNSTRQGFVYINGIEVGQVILPLYLTAPVVPFTIGGARIYGRGPGLTYYSGYIDHLTISSRLKTPCEIYLNANLHCYFKFDSPSSLIDSGPNFLIANQIGTTTTIPGYVNQALRFSSSPSYVSISQVTPLQSIYDTFTISMWIKPTTIIGGATIIHTSTQSNGQGTCLAMWGLTSAGLLVVNVMNSSNAVLSTSTSSPIPLNTWTHITQTFSSTNGVRLYVDAILVASSNVSSGRSVGPFVFIGASLSTSCNSGSIVQGQFYGSVDELRIFRNELNATDICRLVYYL